jgi:GT2 family glycosyltransferase
MKIALFTLTKDRYNYTKLMLESLKKTTHIDYAHFIIDQGSKDQTISELQNTDESVKVYVLPKNIGLNRGLNFAINAVGSDYDILVKVDNDALFITDNWLEKCLNVFEEKLVLSPYVLGLLDNRGGVPRIGYDLERKIGFTPAIGGICMIATRKAWTEDSSGMDYPVPLYVQNSDMKFCQRLKLKGYRFGYKEDVFIKHMDTSLGQIEKYKEYFKIRQTEKTNIL